MADQSSSAILHTFKNQPHKMHQRAVNLLRERDKTRGATTYTTQCPCDSKAQHPLRKCHCGSSLRVIHLFIPFFSSAALSQVGTDQRKVQDCIDLLHSILYVYMPKELAPNIQTPQLFGLVSNKTKIQQPFHVPGADVCDKIDWKQTKRNISLAVVCWRHLTNIFITKPPVSAAR